MRPLTAATARFARAASCAAVAEGEGRAISTTSAARPSLLVIWLMRRDRRYGGLTGTWGAGVVWL